MEAELEAQIKAIEEWARTATDKEKKAATDRLDAFSRLAFSAHGATRAVLAAEEESSRAEYRLQKLDRCDPLIADELRATLQ